MIYTLTGLMGSGKSTLGRMLSARLPHCSFIDLDDWIEKMTGRTIPDIFAREGEAAFRTLETEALMDAVTTYEDGTMLLSLGGGTLLRERNREIVRAVSHCIYLRATAATLAERLQGKDGGRPLLQGEGSLEEKLSRLLAAREALYEAAADHCIDTDGKSPEAVAAEIESIVKR